jgi:hypothetical protein
MRRFFGVILVALLSVLLFAPVSAAAEQAPVLSTNDLVENSYKWDGKTVTFQGEVLQDLMERKDGLWMNLSDGNNTAMGVFVPKSVVMPVISRAENYRTSGDTVLVTGTFHRACAQDQGETDIHATTVTVVKPGASKENPLHTDRVIWFLVLLGLLAIVLWLYYRKPTRGTDS